MMPTLHPFDQLKSVFDELKSLFKSINDFSDISTERDSFKIRLVEWCVQGNAIHDKLTYFLSHEFVPQDDDEETAKSLIHLLSRVDTNREQLGEWIDFFNGQLLELSEDLKN